MARIDTRFIRVEPDMPQKDGKYYAVKDREYAEASSIAAAVSQGIGKLKHVVVTLDLDMRPWGFQGVTEV